MSSHDDTGIQRCAKCGSHEHPSASCAEPGVTSARVPPLLQRRVTVGDNRPISVSAILPDSITVECPVCDEPQEDHDGFGVLHCAKCGYCKHPSAIGVSPTPGITYMQCELCSALECICQGADRACGKCGGHGWITDKPPLGRSDAERSLAFKTLHRVYHDRNFRVHCGDFTVEAVARALAIVCGIEAEPGCPACRAGHRFEEAGW